MTEKPIKEFEIPARVRLEVRAFEDYCRADLRCAIAHEKEQQGMANAAEWIRGKVEGDVASAEAGLGLLGRRPVWLERFGR